MKRSFFIIPLLSLLLFSACQQQTEVTLSSDDYASPGGYVPEKFIPADVTLFASFSLTDDQQYEAFMNLQDRFESETDAESADFFANGFDQEFGQFGVSFEEDIVPALGDQYRAVMGVRALPTSVSPSEEGEVFAVLTLENPGLMKETMSTLVEAGELSERPLSKVTAYVDSEESTIMAVQGDLLVLSNSVLAFPELFELEDSLFDNENYALLMEQGDSSSMIYGAVFPQNLIDAQESLDAIGALSQAPVGALAYQSFWMSATDEGFDFDAYLQKDASEKDFSFLDFPRQEAYLYKDFPAAGLMAYMETFGLKQSMEQAAELEGEASLAELDANIRSLTGLSSDEFFSFLDKGMAFALHRDEGSIIPSFSIYADVSSDVSLASTFMDTMSQQLGAFTSLIASGVPGGISQSVERMQNADFDSFSMDLGFLADLAAPNPDGSASELKLLEGSSLNLRMGVIRDRMLITTSDAFMDEFYDSIEENEAFSALMRDELSQASEGLVLGDPSQLAGLFNEILNLRGDLGLPEPDQPSLQSMSEFLSNFGAFVASSESSEETVHFVGFLSLD